MDFLEYVEGTKEFDLPVEGDPNDVLIKYVANTKNVLEEHENEVGSGLLAHRLVTVLAWITERIKTKKMNASEIKDYIKRRF